MNKKYKKKNYTKRKYTKIQKKNSKKKGGYIIPYVDIIREPMWRIGRSGNSFTTLVQIKIYNTSDNTRFELPVYGSSLPSTFYFECYATFSYYFYTLDIKRILSLHACNTNNQATYCEGQIDQIDDNGRNWENEIWENLKASSQITKNDSDIEFIDNNIDDMTAGNIIAWENIRSLDYLKSPILVHCLAGFGRTGSVLLYFIINYLYTKQIYGCNDFTKEYFGEDNSNDMYNFLIEIFLNNLIVKKQHNHQFNNNFNKVDPIAIELFNIKSVYHANLLIQRINYIILNTVVNCFGNNRDLKFYLYTVIDIHDPNDSRKNNLSSSTIFVPIFTSINSADLNSFGINIGNSSFVSQSSQQPP